MSGSILPLLLQLPGCHLTYEEGEGVFRIGDEVQNLRLICEGRVNLVRHQPDGAKLILQRAVEGAVLAEASLHSANYHCDAVAEATSLTWTIRRGRFAVCPPARSCSR